MEATRKVDGDVVVSEDLANRIIDGLSKIEEGTQQLGAAVLALTAPKPAAAVECVDEPIAEPRVWDLSDAALNEYDAEQLVALRRDHRGDNHEPAGCSTCVVLERRLGSL